MSIEVFPTLVVSGPHLVVFGRSVPALVEFRRNVAEIEPELVKPWSVSESCRNQRKFGKHVSASGRPRAPARPTDRPTARPTAEGPALKRRPEVRHKKFKPVPILTTPPLTALVATKDNRHDGERSVAKPLRPAAHGQWIPKSKVHTWTGERPVHNRLAALSITLRG